VVKNCFTCSLPSIGSLVLHLTNVHRVCIIVWTFLSTVMSFQCWPCLQLLQTETKICVNGVYKFEMIGSSGNQSWSLLSNTCLLFLSGLTENFIIFAPYSSKFVSMLYNLSSLNNVT
jgi:hypothetical protein